MIIGVLILIAAILLFGAAAVKNAILGFLGFIAAIFALGIFGYSLGVNPIFLILGLAILAAVPLWFLDRDRKKSQDLDARYRQAISNLDPDLRDQIIKSRKP